MGKLGVHVGGPIIPGTQPCQRAVNASTPAIALNPAIAIAKRRNSTSRPEEGGLALHNTRLN
jgi:hypothetical protein